MPGKIAKISLPSSATPGDRRRAENFKSRMYTAVDKNKQEYLNQIHDEAEAFVRGIAGASIGPRVVLAAELVPAPAPLAAAPDPAGPDLLDLAHVEPVANNDLRAAINKAEKYLSLAKDIIAIGDEPFGLPSEMRTWAINYITRVN